MHDVQDTLVLHKSFKWPQIEILWWNKEPLKNEEINNNHTTLVKTIFYAYQNVQHSYWLAKKLWLFFLLDKMCECF